MRLFNDGTYKCAARNSIGKSEFNFTVNVKKIFVFTSNSNENAVIQGDFKNFFAKT